LTKSETAEISKNNISIVPTDLNEHLSPENAKIISHIVHSVYDRALQQYGTHEELHYDMKNANFFFPHKGASLIISKILNCPLETISSQDSCPNPFSDLDIVRIVERHTSMLLKWTPGVEIKGFQSRFN
jgi:hypothetical protein